MTDEPSAETRGALHTIRSLIQRYDLFLVAGIFLMFWNVLWSLKTGAKAPADPWGGTTLEWTIPSPPPTENFHEVPVIAQEKA